ncbi:sigma 54-interacting transcriptional regulator [Mediterraneibacter agrestimuris]|uniref:sigma 54-interacting transcriptional regulator n=1 Tax=Mediterraneibacter agrestimuris TaxID=2941333 RepID=UPI00203CAF90|nr:sigma 54-interacting transcriptional regulator [Mediterraneibacter agrestimuris]
MENKKEKRADKIYQIISKHSQNLELSYLETGLVFLQIQNIARETGITPNNVSLESKKLYESGCLIRIGNRPVAYASLVHIENLLGRTVETRFFPSVDSFIQYCLPNQETYHTQSGLHLTESFSDSSFEHIIGCRESLSTPIKQAKAAMLYPPHGLHALLTGPTGAGKSMFARAMYDFASRSGRIQAGKSLITLNCANYADNPQLLMSLLFGYVKGAFTGAERERKGLIDQANDSILFLDEIHRLSPEGQEKLFLLMDQGVYSRLGQTEQEHRANVLIIGATTENPSEVMLHTFLRRMPAQISLPALRERTIHERLQLVIFFLWKESQNIHLRISTHSAVINALCSYECSANIGQLSSDIKLACANAYFDYLSAVSPSMLVHLRHLTEQVHNGLYIIPTESSKILDPILKNEQLVIDGSSPFQQNLKNCIREHDDLWGSTTI